MYKRHISITKKQCRCVCWIRISIIHNFYEMYYMQNNDVVFKDHIFVISMYNFCTYVPKTI